MQFNTIDSAIEAFRQGKMVLVIDNENRENEGDLVAAAANISAETINFMATHAKGLICTPLSGALADRLGLTPMVEKNTDNHETAFTVSIDYRTTTTGISAFERAITIDKLLDPTTQPADLRRPGHVFPLRAVDGGVLARAGHTEATVTLAQLAGLPPAGVCCEIMADDGQMMRAPQLYEFAQKYQLPFITVESLRSYCRQHQKTVQRVAEADLPSKYGHFHLYAYENQQGKCHLAIVKGAPKAHESTLVRLHSECLTGDVLGSLRCDCGDQLATALRQIEKNGSGILLYMRQEGRGIGLANKIRAYALQDQGKDTVEANELLGFAADLRDYAESAEILADLGVQSIELLSNNPQKAVALAQYGIKVEKMLPLEMTANCFDHAYLSVKKEKMGHLLQNI